MVSVTTGGQMRKSMTQLVLAILYLMFRWNYCKYVATSDGGHSTIFLVFA
jgi:hypothetical protein